MNSLCSPSGVFIARGKEDVLVTRNMVTGESVYGEKRISVDVSYSIDAPSSHMTDPPY